MGLENFSYNCLGAQIATGFVGFDKTSPYTNGTNFYSVPSILGKVTVIHPKPTSGMGASYHPVQSNDTNEVSMKTVVAVHDFAMEVFQLAA
jgi:hypothetical protein